MRGAAVSLAVAGSFLLAACAGHGGSGDLGAARTPSSPTPDPPVQSSTPPAENTAQAAGPPAVPACEGPEVVRVVDERTLSEALENARAGQVIHVADGRYEGNFVAGAQARPEAPILLCGTRDAVLDGGDIDGDYTLHLSGASYWHLLGFTVTGGQKGVMVDAGVGNRIEALLVTSMGDEAIHLRTNSTDNVVVANTIRDTGLRKPKYGEGVYVGSAESNWCQLTDCRPDRSDRNLVQANDIAGTTAEAVDIKEGTSDGVLQDNVFEGSDMVDADSWVDVKGNGWTIRNNSGTSSPEDGFQVHEVVDGWGRGTVFSGNTVDDVPGYAVNIAGPRTIRNSTTVLCDGGGGGVRSNVECIDR